MTEEAIGPSGEATAIALLSDCVVPVKLIAF